MANGAGGKNMNASVQKFLKKVAADEALQAKMQSITDVDEAYALASSVQGGFTKEEFAEEMARLQDSVDEDEELGMDDLMAVAGGQDDGSESQGDIHVFSFSCV